MNERYNCRVVATKLDGQPIWCYDCIRTDKKIAITTSFAPGTRISIPIVHHSVDLEHADNESTCPILDSPCCMVISGYDVDQLQALHGGKVEPLPRFWDHLIELADDAKKRFDDCLVAPLTSKGQNSDND